MITRIISLLVAVSLAAPLFAVVSVTQNYLADDVAWPALPAISAGGTELYDARSLTITDGQGLSVESVRIVLDTTGTFDDSIAMDINGDGTIDFATTQDDAYFTPGIGSGSGNYQPWVDASPYTFDAVITQAGTTLTSYWNGVEIIQGSGSGASGFNNAAPFTLQDWGFSAGGVVPSANFTTGELRLGNINVNGPSGHDIAFSFDAVLIRDTSGEVYIFDPDGDGIPPSVPEPGLFAFTLGLGTLILVLRRRRVVTVMETERSQDI